MKENHGLNPDLWLLPVFLTHKQSSWKSHQSNVLEVRGSVGQSLNPHLQITELEVKDAKKEAKSKRFTQGPPIRSARAHVRGAEPMVCSGPLWSAAGLQSERSLPAITSLILWNALPKGLSQRGMQCTSFYNQKTHLLHLTITYLPKNRKINIPYESAPENCNLQYNTKEEGYKFKPENFNVMS